MGDRHGEQPLLDKEGIRPALMIVSPALTCTAFPFPKDASQPHSYPGILPGKVSPLAVLEVFEPASGRPVDVRDDHCQTAAVAAFRFLADRIPEFLDALIARPSLASLKAIPQEFKTLAGRVYDPRLFWMQDELSSSYPFLDLPQRLLGLFPASA